LPVRTRRKRLAPFRPGEVRHVTQFFLVKGTVRSD
jgi:hypothetical protein